ncbi:MAG: hypothetical protein HND47_03850 [Chloroflexi bacterium]|nr:hypothetical protein [Chloroflexota bacterium]
MTNASPTANSPTSTTSPAAWTCALSASARLECLIKVGALDCFGNRASLLAALDRIVSISSNHFRAADAGQMSLFGANTGVVDEIRLPEVKDVEKREMLNWERELIGLYISDHPLNEYQAALAQIVSYFTGQLSEANHEEKVRVAGLITGVRPYTTKTGKPMGFVQIEDIQGAVELVLFPKTREQARAKMVAGQIIIVEGKVDPGLHPAQDSGGYGQDRNQGDDGGGGYDSQSGFDPRAASHPPPRPASVQADACFTTQADPHAETDSRNRRSSNGLCPPFVPPSSWGI